MFIPDLFQEFSEHAFPVVEVDETRTAQLCFPRILRAPPPWMVRMQALHCVFKSTAAADGAINKSSKTMMKICIMHKGCAFTPSKLFKKQRQTMSYVDFD